MVWICNAFVLCVCFLFVFFSVSLTPLFFHLLSVYIADLFKALYLRWDALMFAILHLLYAWTIFVNQLAEMEEEFW